MKAEDIKFTLEVFDDYEHKVHHLNSPLNLKEILDGDSFTSKDNKHSLSVKDFAFFCLFNHFDEESSWYELHVETPETKKYKNLQKIFKKYGCLDLSLIRSCETYSEYVETYKELYWNAKNEYKCMVNETEFNLLEEMWK